MGKVCTKCGLEQPETNFSKDGNTHDGLQYVCRDCNKEYYAEHREKRRKSDAEYNEANKEHISERMKQYYVGHKETVFQQHKVWVANNKDKARKATATWVKNHPEVCKVYDQNRRAKKAGLARTLTTAHWNHILNGFNNTCAYCGAGDKKLHQEHFIPLSTGGEYTHDNIIPACGRCNSSKGKKDFFIWYPKCDFYDKVREKKVMRFLHYTGSSQQLTLFT